LMLLPSLLKAAVPRMKVRLVASLTRYSLFSALVPFPPPLTQHAAVPLPPRKQNKTTGRLVPPHALPLLRDLPHPPRSRRSPPRRPPCRPHRVPHLRLRAPLHQQLHAHSRARRHARGRRGQRRADEDRRVPHRHRPGALHRRFRRARCARPRRQTAPSVCRSQSHARCRPFGRH